MDAVSKRPRDKRAMMLIRVVSAALSLITALDQS
jgi:hypothetical protein